MEVLIAILKLKAVMIIPKNVFKPQMATNEEIREWGLMMGFDL